ncbi:hypothetical protein CJF31_00000784 [Rutstroemia sp. NJR-2017a BVV2]|nr:hypothetical protein CJF31_00000784 [Rutstroemia sp. NJR-2017a BVV2]
MKMVAHASYYSEEDPTFHRCGRGGHNYPLAQERLENAHGPSRTYGDGRNGDHAQEQEQNTQVRRRVPVAMSALSLEQPPDLNEFNYDPSSRSLYHVPSHSQLPGYGYQGQISTLGADSSYRSFPQSYGYPESRIFGLSYSDFPDNSIDFGLSSSTYQVVSPEPTAVSSYPSSNNNRSRIGASAVYMTSPGSVYSQNTLPYQSNYSVRPTLTSDLRNFPLNAIPSPLTTSTSNGLAGNERVLPQPSVNRSFTRSHDGLPVLSNSQHALQSYNTASSPMMNGDGQRTINEGAVQENAALPSLYMSLPTTSQEITTEAAQLAYNSQQIPMSQPEGDLYAPQTSHQNLTYYSQTNDSSNELSNYGTSNTNDRSRQSSQTNTTENSLSANHHKYSGATLTSGREYTPNPPQASYPLPNMPNMQAHNTLQHLPQLTRQHNLPLPPTSLSSR